MCGIFFVKSLANKNLFAESTANIIFNIHKERGPDEKKAVIKDNWMMVHTRLSITSPKEGHQPISNDLKTAYMIFNGEIYNYKSIAKKLNFKPNKDFSDTDVLFKSIEVYGFHKTIKMLRGMFAIIYYNLKNEKVFVARDHFGQKPIWIYKNRDTIALSSTIKSLVKVFNNELDYSKILHVVSKQGKPCSTFSFYNSISGLAAGEILEIDKNLYNKSYEYFNFESIIDNQIYIENQKDPKKNLDNAIKETIAIHSDTKSNLGIFLSGGFDSSLILNYSRESKSVSCFTKLCPGVEEIPLEVIPKLMKKYPSDIFFKVITPKIYLIELFEFIKINLTIPKWGGTPAMRSLSRLANTNGIKVILGGDGIDESMLGYDSHKDFFKEEKETKIHKILAGEPLLAEYSEEDNLELINKRKIIEDNLSEFMSNQEAYTQSFLFQDTLEFLQRCNLPSSDLFSMNESVELRNPFVDIHFLKLALNIPLIWKFNKSKEGKYIFKILSLEKIGNIFSKHKEGTRNYSRLLSDADNWNFNLFKIIHRFDVLRNFKNFKQNTRFTIICLEILIRIIENPTLEIKDLEILLTKKGEDIFLK